MTPAKGLHWVGPTIIGTSLIISVLLAVGHHLFYSGLQGTTATDDDLHVLGSQVSRQQLNIAGGTAFAFLVKAALATAVSTAYLQVFWRAVMRVSRPATLETLDTTFAALSNALMLFKFWVWRRYPLLFSLAATIWLLPIASVVTPATLSVVNAPVAPRVSRLMSDVPNIDFVSLNYVDAMTPGVYQTDGGMPDESNEFYYYRASVAVESIVQAVAGGGSILPIDHPGSNTSWTLEFPGPALQCSNVSSDFRTTVQRNIFDATYSPSCIPVGYVAWTGPTVNGLGPLPYLKSGNSSYTQASNTLGPALDFYIAAMPNMMPVYLNGDDIAVPFCSENTVFPSGFGRSTLIRCQLINSTYHTDFDYTNGRQNITKTRVEPIKSGPPLAMVSSVWWPPGTTSHGSNTGVPECGFQDPACSFNQTLLSTLSYQAILQSFSALLFGSVSSGDTMATFSTSIQLTTLINSPELQFLTQPTVESSVATANTLQQAVTEYQHRFLGLVNTSPTTSAVPLISTLEELFQKTVISMMSSKALQPNPESAFAPPPINVTYHDFHNVYSYSPVKLWLAYGLAIIFATVAASIGLTTLMANGASFGSNFSAVFLVGRGATMSVEPRSDDMSGRDPLPSRLSKAKVWVSTVRKGGARSDSYRLHDAVNVNQGSDAKSSLLGSQAGKARTL